MTVPGTYTLQHLINIICTERNTAAETALCTLTTTFKNATNHPEIPESLRGLSQKLKEKNLNFDHYFAPLLHGLLERLRREPNKETATGILLALDFLAFQDGEQLSQPQMEKLAQGLENFALKPPYPNLPDAKAFEMILKIYDGDESTERTDSLCLRTLAGASRQVKDLAAAKMDELYCGEDVLDIKLNF